MTIRSTIRKAVLQTNEPFTTAKLFKLTGIRRRQIRSVLTHLVNTGEIRVTEKVLSQKSPIGYYNKYETVKVKAAPLGLFLYSDEELLAELKRRLAS